MMATTENQRCYNKSFKTSLMNLLVMILLLIVIVTGTAENTPKLPNFVLILTDDLDLTLGSTEFLKKTRHYVADQGMNVPNWFVHTPVCCPSRSELLTGRMFHNLKVSRQNPKSPSGCMHIDVEADLNHQFYSKYYFAQHFAKMGFTVGVFGKHLNNYNTAAPPSGVDRWMVNGGGEYLNPSFTWASSGVEPTQVHFNNCTDQPCYSTSVIGNSSIAWIRDHVKSNVSHMPFFAYVAVKAPHIQDGNGYPVSIPAPWYANATVDNKHRRAPRTPNYNASCPDHHWLVRQQPPLTDIEASKVDELYVSRLRTLLSVDDLVEEMISTLDELEVLDNTYVLFTSDNGYRFGQFRMPQGKFHVYENDIRVPFMIRGPGIHPNVSKEEDILGTHVDIMPTLIGLAKRARYSNNISYATVPSTMDGEDLSLDFLSGPSIKHNRQQRTTLLIEYIGLADVVRYNHLEDTYNNTFRALRIIDKRQPKGMQNLKYVEFFDWRDDWNSTQKPLELELYDLDKDPYEMYNLISVASDKLINKLRETTRRLFTCSGKSCRGINHQPNKMTASIERK